MEKIFLSIMLGAVILIIIPTIILIWFMALDTIKDYFKNR